MPGELGNFSQGNEAESDRTQNTEHLTYSYSSDWSRHTHTHTTNTHTQTHTPLTHIPVKIYMYTES
jgi:hypothetical protein